MTKRLLSFLLSLVITVSVFAAIPTVTASADDTIDPPKASENVALGKPTNANGDAATSGKITDGNTKTAWTTSGVPKYVEVDLQANYDIERIVVWMPGNYSCAFSVYTSLDGVNFDRAYYMSTPEQFVSTAGKEIVLDSPVCARVVRVMITMSSKGSGSYSSLSELQVYGTPSQNTEVIPTRTNITISSYDEWLLKNCGVDLSTIKDASGKYDIKDTYTKEDTVNALQGLVSRVLGSAYISWFEFEIGSAAESGNDYYELSDKNGKIHIKGNEGVSCAVGLNYYLKYYCKVNVSEETKQVKMPKAIIPVGKTIYNETPFEVRYAFNYCTLSYTMPFYGFDEWQRTLDYQMLSGINVVLDTTATETLWVLFLQNYGYSLQDAVEFVCGYTWKAWWLMGNLEGYGGPVSDSWLIDTVELARVNQRYLAVMGADPCLEVFTGTLPIDFKTKAASALMEMGYPDPAGYMTSTGGWCGFTRPYAMNTTYPGFSAMAKKFYEVQNMIYGRIGDYYAGDFLHEIDGGFKLDPSFDKAKMSRAVLDNLLAENDEAVWVIQSWWENPLPDVVKGWGDDREDHILLLDLAAAQGPRWTNTDRFGGYEFGGTSWCYCILENYGGRTGIHGNLKNIVIKLQEAKNTAKHIKGIGFTSEGSERNPALFDLWWELAWLDDVEDAAGWIVQWAEDYAVRRYGEKADKSITAWTSLVKFSLYSVGTVDGTTINNAITNYPKLDYTGGYFYPENYRLTKLESSLKHMLQDYDKLCGEETYVYDVVDLYRFELSAQATNYLANMFKAAKEADYATFHANKTKYLQAMMLVDELSAYVQHQLLGNWVGRVDTWVNDRRTGTYCDFDIDLMKLDAGILVTNWSTIDLGNYANREYNGLMSDYYYEMWNKYLTKAENTILKGNAITDGNASLGINNVVDNYNIGRLVALRAVYGDSFISTAVPVSGDATHRSLKEVMTEVQNRFFYTVKSELNTATLKSDSGLSVSAEGILSGKTDVPLTAGALSTVFTTTEGGKVVFLNAKGKACQRNDTVESGMTVAIMEDDGSILKLNMTVGTLESTNSKITGGMKLEETTEKIKAFISKYATWFSAQKAAELNRFTKAAETALNSGSGSESRIDMLLKNADHVSADAQRCVDFTYTNVAQESIALSMTILGNYSFNLVFAEE